MPAYLVHEGIFGVEGTIITQEDLSDEECAAVFECVDLAIYDFNTLPSQMRYERKIDKAEMINFYLKRFGFKDVKYHYLG
jgi:hypothetical protein